MAILTMTRDQIVTQGLELGGNTAITDLTNSFLDLFLDTLARAKDFESLVKEASISAAAGNEEVTIGQADYRSIKTLHLDGDDQPLIQEDHTIIWRKLRVDKENGQTGIPTHFAINPVGDKILLYPVPKNAETGKILYYSIPDSLAGDDTPFVKDANILVSAVADFAAMYDRDTMQQIITRNVAMAMGIGMTSIDDHGRSRMKQLKFEPTVYKIWRGDG